MKPLAAPAGAHALLGAALPQVERYAGWLAGPGIERGLLGPREADRIWSRHILNCAGLEPLIAAGASVCDVGSGAGLPGLVLALLRPDLQVVLLEPLLRRTLFLQEVLVDLGLETVSVERARAEDYASQRPEHDVAVARAVAPIGTLAGWALPLVHPSGSLLAMKGATASEELLAAAAALDRLGGVDREVVTVGEGPEATQVIRIVRSPDSRVEDA